MSWSYRHLRGKLFASDENAGGGGAATADPPEGAGEGAGDGAGAAGGGDGEGEGAGGQGSGDGEGEGQGAADGEGAGETPPEPKVRDLTDAEIEERARRMGLVRPEVKPEAEAAKPDRLIDTPEFRKQAYREVQNHPRAREMGWIDDDGDLTAAGQSKAENYSLDLAAEHREQQRSAAVMAERAKVLEAQRPSIIANALEGFKADGVEEPQKVAEDYAAAIIGYGPEAEERTPEGQKMRDAAYIYALGLAALRKLQAAKEGGNGQQSRREPVGGAVPKPGPGLSEVDQAFLKDWAQVHNQGKPASKEQIERLRAEGVIE